jgi:hypothetical protein
MAKRISELGYRFLFLGKDQAIPLYIPPQYAIKIKAANDPKMTII